MIEKVLQEYQERNLYHDKILGALSLAYDFTDPTTSVYRESACLGNVYDYMSKALEEVNGVQFQQYIRNYLENELECIIVNSLGRMWCKGLKAKDPTVDNQVAQRVLEQHYKDRALYRERQRAHGLKAVK